MTPFPTSTEPLISITRGWSAIVADDDEKAANRGGLYRDFATLLLHRQHAGRCAVEELPVASLVIGANHKDCSKRCPFGAHLGCP